MSISETTNLGLSKPVKGDRNWGQTVNNNMDLLDAAYGNYVTTADDLPQVYVYSDTFNSTTGRTITLPNEVDAVTEYSVTITPTTRAGAIGDIYVTKTTTNFVVKCSGANTTDTFAAVVYYIGDVSNYGGSIYRRWYVSPDSSITDHGNASTTGSLAWVAAQISTSPAVIEMPGNKNYQIKQDVTLAGNILYQPQPGAIIDTAFSIRDSNYEWYQNGATSEYYLQSSGGGNPNINMPSVVIENNARMNDGAAGSLAAGEWDWNDVNGLGYSTVYVRLSDSTDPDSKSADYVEAGYHVFFGAGGVEYIYPQWLGAVCDGATADDTPLAAAFTAGSAAEIPVKVIGDFAINAQAGVFLLPNLKLIGESPATSIFRCISASPQTALTQDPNDGTPDALGDVEMRNIRFIGNSQYTADTFTYGYGVRFRGAADSIIIDNCEFENFPLSGVTCHSMGGDQALVRITNNKVTCTDSLIGMQGIKITGSSQAYIQNNAMTRISFGITMEIGGGGTWGDSEAVIISGNEIQDGDASSVSATQEYTGIHVQLDTGNTCEQLIISNNIFHDNVDDDVTAADIYVQCDDDDAIDNVLISNNLIYNSNSAYMIRVNNLRGATIIGNVMRNPTRSVGTMYGIYIVGQSEDTLVASNTFYGANFDYDIIEISGANAPLKSRIYLNNLSQSGDIYIDDTESQAIEYANVAGFTHASGVGPVTYVLDNWNKIPYVLVSSAGATSTSGTGEDTIMTKTVPANTMGATGGLVLEVWGIKTGANGNKTIKVYFGATSATIHAAANNTNTWYFKTIIQNKNASLQRMFTIFSDDDVAPNIIHANPAEDTTGDVTLKVTGECADGGDLIEVRMTKIRAE